MKTYVCDICGKNTDHLSDLLELYQTREIKQVCADCEKIVNAHSSQLMGLWAQMKKNWLKQFMTNMRARIQGSKP